HVQVAGNGPAGDNFYVAVPGTAGSDLKTHQPLEVYGPQDFILIANGGGNFTYAATFGEIVTVTGVLGRVDGYFAIFPRNDADITRYGALPTFSLPFDVSKSATQSRDPDIVSGANGELFMAWGRVHHESVHSLSLDHTQNWSIALPIMHQGVQPALAVTPSDKIGVLSAGADALFFK